jgi:thiamine monophosphate kinase
VVDVDALPLPDGLPDGRPYWTQGEDYELLAALAPEDPLAADFPVVGRVEAGEGVALRRAGEELELEGWDHFLS